jgi:hypothetical protein
MAVLKDGAHGRPKRRRACRGPSVAPVPLNGRSAGVARAGSRVWACARCRQRSFFSTAVCAVAESADAQPRALAAAAAVRVPTLFMSLIAVSYPAPPQCYPVVDRNRPSGRVSGPRRKPSSDPLWPDGPVTRPDGWFRRTKGGGRPSQVLCGPAGPGLAEIHLPSTPRDPQTLAMVQGATPDAAF